MPRESFEKLPEQRKKIILGSGIAEFARKSYTEACTDEITKASGISKGSLFHYFGSKRDFYFQCLDQALSTLTTLSDPDPHANSFYDILFSMMDAKLNLCYQFPNETRLANMAARETCAEVNEGRKSVILKHMVQAKVHSRTVLAKAISFLPLKNPDELDKVTAGLSIYINSLISLYLETYQERPDAFFHSADTIKAELKTYIDLMLFGIMKENIV